MRRRQHHIVLVREPRAQALDQDCGLHREAALDVQVVDVDRYRHGDVVLAEPVRVVELRSLVLGEDLRRGPVRPQSSQINGKTCSAVK